MGFVSSRRRRLAAWGSNPAQSGPALEQSILRQASEDRTDQRSADAELFTQFELGWKTVAVAAFAAEPLAKDLLYLNRGNGRRCTKFKLKPLHATVH
jgi:hypothetical protein